MAVRKYTFLDELGVTTFASYLLQRVGNIVTSKISTEITDASYTDQNHVLAAQTVLDLIGNIDEYEHMTGEGNTILDKIKSLELALGNIDDTADAETIHGQIEYIKTLLSNLNYLKYAIVTGEIDQVADPDPSTIYLRHDEDETYYERYIYNNGWVLIGDTNIDYNDYYSKSDEDLQEIRNNILDLVDDESIDTQVTSVFDSTELYSGRPII